MFLTPYNDDMARIRIKHFGPIGEGFVEDEFIPLHKITVFIGPQGAGKALLRKLFLPSCGWKRLFLGGIILQKPLLRKNLKPVFPTILWFPTFLLIQNWCIGEKHFI